MTAVATRTLVDQVAHYADDILTRKAAWIDAEPFIEGPDHRRRMLAERCAYLDALASARADGLERTAAVDHARAATGMTRLSPRRGTPWPGTWSETQDQADDARRAAESTDRRRF